MITSLTKGREGLKSKLPQLPNRHRRTIERALSTVSERASECKLWDYRTAKEPH
jgi:hypothetical protein